MASLQFIGKLQYFVEQEFGLYFKFRDWGKVYFVLNPRHPDLDQKITCPILPNELPPKYDINGNDEGSNIVVPELHTLVAFGGVTVSRGYCLYLCGNIEIKKMVSEAHYNCLTAVMWQAKNISDALIEVWDNNPERGSTGHEGIFLIISEGLPDYALQAYYSASSALKLVIKACILRLERNEEDRKEMEGKYLLFAPKDEKSFDAYRLNGMFEFDDALEGLGVRKEDVVLVRIKGLNVAREVKYSIQSYNRVRGSPNENSVDVNATIVLP
jgi:hypothetical protein